MPGDDVQTQGFQTRLAASRVELSTTSDWLQQPVGQVAMLGARDFDPSHGLRNVADATADVDILSLVFVCASKSRRNQRMSLPLALARDVHSG